MTEHSPQLDELAGALCAAQAEFTKIPKDQTNPFFKSRYAALPKVVEVASPILAKHGLMVSQWIGHGDGGDTLTTWLMHSSGQYIRQSMRLHLVKDDPQGQGSAVTYARRYSYMAVLGLVADEDDDGNAASRAPRAPRAQPQQRQPSAAEVQPTQRIATAKQRGLIMARAQEAGMDASRLANLVLQAGGSGPREWESEQHAQEWLKRSMDRLPASLVDRLLEQIQAVEEIPF